MTGAISDLQRTISDISDVRAIEAEMPLDRRWTARTLYEQVCETATRHGTRPALSFQLTAGRTDKSETLTWDEVRCDVTRLANLLRRLGIGEEDVVCTILPNCNEAAIAALAGMTAGIVNPLSPALSVGQMTDILRKTRTRVVITLAPLPETALSAHVALAVAGAPDVETVLEVDLARLLLRPVRWYARLTRPRRPRRRGARVVAFDAALRSCDGTALEFTESRDDRVCALFHTGGNSGRPSVVHHRASGMLYNGWIGSAHVLTDADVLMCPLPAFHVFSVFQPFLSCLMSGARFVMPTLRGYADARVIENFWKLVARYGVTRAVVMRAPVAALLERDIDADISTLRTAFCGAAPVPPDLARSFTEKTGAEVVEGYGTTEATCLICVNPVGGKGRIGSVGLRAPYTDVRVLHRDERGEAARPCPPPTPGEICVRSPGDAERLYLDTGGPVHQLTSDGFLRTGDLGYIDEDGFIWLTGRVDDVIVRSGISIDPRMIETAFLRHPAIAAACVVGQPDSYSGEVPAVYVELKRGARADIEELMEHARQTIHGSVALPRHIEIVRKLPRSLLGTTLTSELRKEAIARVLNGVLSGSGASARVIEVVEDVQHGLMAVLAHGASDGDDRNAQSALRDFAVPWCWLVDDLPGPETQAPG